jgi:hypothetical protein
MKEKRILITILLVAILGLLLSWLPDFDLGDQGLSGLAVSKASATNSEVSQETPPNDENDEDIIPTPPPDPTDTPIPEPTQDDDYSDNPDNENDDEY